MGFAENIPNRETKHQKAATEFFEKNRSAFKYVKAEYIISTEGLYIFRPGHEKGDFIGKLFAKVLSDNGIDRGYQRAYGIFKDAIKT